MSLTIKKETLAGVEGLVIKNIYYFDKRQLAEQDLQAIAEEAAVVTYLADNAYEVDQVFKDECYITSLGDGYLFVEPMDETALSDIETYPLSPTFRNMLVEAQKLGYDYVAACEHMPRRAMPLLRKGEIYRNNGQLYRIKEHTEEGIKMTHVSSGATYTEHPSMFCLFYLSGAPIYQYVDYRG